MPKQRTEAGLVDAIEDLDQDVLAETYSPDDVDAELKVAGADPKEVGVWGADLVKTLKKRRRLAWQADAQRVRDALQQKLAGRPIVAALPRAELIARIEAAKKDPRLQGSLAMAARNLAGEVSDEELRQLVEDIEALALLAEDRGEIKK